MYRKEKSQLLFGSELKPGALRRKPHVLGQCCSTLVLSPPVWICVMQQDRYFFEVKHSLNTTFTLFHVRYYSALFWWAGVERWWTSYLPFSVCDHVCVSLQVQHYKSTTLFDFFLSLSMATSIKGLLSEPEFTNAKHHKSNYLKSKQTRTKNSTLHNI